METTRDYCSQYEGRSVRHVSTKQVWKVKYGYTLILFMISLLPMTEALCYSVTVTGDTYSTSINDYYYALSGYCQYYNVWGDDYLGNGQYLHYLSYRTNFNIRDSQGANATISSAWTIRSFGCASNSEATIYAYSEGYYPYPYNVPSGSWYQWDPSSNTFQRNYNLSVDCYYPALSAWAIVGIVIGSLCAAAMLIALIACICSHSKKRQQRTQAPVTSRPPPPAAIYTAENDCATITTVGGTPAGYGNPAFSMPISPPAYDNSPPPVYSK